MPSVIECNGSGCFILIWKCQPCQHACNYTQSDRTQCHCAACIPYTQASGQCIPICKAFVDLSDPADFLGSTVADTVLSESPGR